ncbi:DUF2919 family protein [Salmonella enterica]
MSAGGPYYRAEDFNENALLKAPLVFWCALFFQSRAWWLTGLSLLSGENGGWITVFYPDVGWQVAGVLSGLPALAMLFCYPLRSDMPLLSGAAYILMLMVMVLQTCGDVVILTDTVVQGHELVWLSLCADLVCITGLWPDSRLREVFFRR